MLSGSAPISTIFLFIPLSFHSVSLKYLLTVIAVTYDHVEKEYGKCMSALTIRTIFFFCLGESLNFHDSRLLFVDKIR